MVTKLLFVYDLRILFIACAVCQTLFSGSQYSTSKIMVIYVYDAENFSSYPCNRCSNTEIGVNYQVLLSQNRTVH